MGLRNRDLQDVAATFLGSKFGWNVAPIPSTGPREDSMRLGSSVRISGGWEGEISVFVSPELARRAATVIFASDRAELHDGHLREAVRCITGEISADLQGKLQCSCTAHHPSPATIGGGVIRAAPISALLACDGEPCWVLVEGSGVDKQHAHQRPSRRFGRADVDVGVTVTAGETVHRSTGPSNLSMNGVFVRGECAVPRGRDCVVTVCFGEGEDETSVCMAGRVARVTPEGFAVEFLEVNLESYRRLRDLVQFNAARIRASWRDGAGIESAASADWVANEGHGW